MKDPNVPLRDRDPNFPLREKEVLPIVGKDEEIFTLLEPQNRANFLPGDLKDERCCKNRVYVDLSKTYDAKPGICNRCDLEDFMNGLTKYVGAWSVFWHAKSKRSGNVDEVYEDDFRGVVTFKAIEFSIRPVGDRDRPGLMPGLDIARLRISPSDIKDCLSEVLTRYPSTQDFSLSNLGGRGHAIDPRHKNKFNAVPQIPFEWRIAQLPQDRIDVYVHRWRHDRCNEKGRKYDDLIKIYKTYYDGQPPEKRTQFGLLSPVLKPDATLRVHKKRKSRRSSTSPEPVTSHKRQSHDFESRRTEQQLTAPPSGTSSSEAPRSPWIAYGPEAGPRLPPPTISRQHNTNYLPQAQASTRNVYEGRPSNFNIKPPLPALSRLAPAPSASSGGGASSTSGVTRDMSSLSIMAANYDVGRPVSTYQRPDQHHEKPDPYPYPAQPQRTYGDDISQIEIDRSRGIGLLPKPIQYKPQREAGTGKQSNRGGESYRSQLPPPTTMVLGRGQDLGREEQHSSAFLTKGARDYRPGQVIRPPEQAPRQPQNHAQQNRPPPTEGFPGVEAMLRGAPLSRTIPPPTRLVSAIPTSQQVAYTGHHVASRDVSMAAVPPGRANPQPPYQSPRDVWTGRGGGTSQEPAFSRGGSQSGPQGAQELGRGAGRGSGPRKGPDHPREEHEGGFQGVYQGHLGRGGEGRGGGAPSHS